MHYLFNMATRSRTRQATATAPIAKTRKDIFNDGRKLHLSNLPAETTEEEIKQFLGKFKASSVVICEASCSAVVTMTNGSNLDEAVESLNEQDLKDKKVAVRAIINDRLLCIAHIPPSFTHEQFKEFCGKHGTVESSFIMKCDENGDSKGYGFVEYFGDVEKAKQIKNELDWSNLEEQILHVDFLDESCKTWDDLQSRCLLINNMPEDFVDVSKLREMFGCISSPVYCQIIAKGEKSLGYGIIEFRTSEDAEQTWLKLRNEKIGDKDVVMTFCIPGKSAVFINNRIMWTFSEKLQKNSSLLPDPVCAKPVIAGNPIVISLSKLNPKLMDDFAEVLSELQQAYVSQMMSPINKPGLLGPAPSLPLSPMMNPNMQLGLLIMLALHVQRAKKEQFTGVLAKQLNTLSEQDEKADAKSGTKPSILGDPMTGQANVILASLQQQLNQVPLTDDEGKEITEPSEEEIEAKLKHIVRKFVANGRYLNLSLLSNLGQLLVTMKQADTPRPLLSGPSAPTGSSGNKGQSLLGPAPLQPLMSTPIGGGTKGGSLLGDAPGMKPPMGPTNANKMGPGLGMQSMALNNMGQTLLSQISQGLVHQIGQNLLYQMNNQQQQQPQMGGGPTGRGLLGDVPNDGGGVGTMAGNFGTGNNNNTTNFLRGNKGNSLMGRPPMGTSGGMMGATGGGKSSLLGEPPAQSLQSRQSQSMMGSGFKSGGMGGASLDQGAWKPIDNRKRMDMGMDSKQKMESRWGSGAYDSGYANRSAMGSSFNEYGYGGGDSYMDQASGIGNFSGGYGDGGNEYYSYQQQYDYGGNADNVYQTDGVYNYQFGQGYGMGGSGSSSSGGMGGAGSYGMGSGGYGSGSQATGVSFQDGQTFGKGGSVGLGQDSSKFGMDGFGGGMGMSAMGGGMGSGMGGGMGSSMVGGMGSGMDGSMGVTGGMSNYGYGSREDMGYDSYGSLAGSGYGSGMVDSLGDGGFIGRGMNGGMSGGGMGAGMDGGMVSNMNSGMGGRLGSGMLGDGMGNGGMSGIGSGGMSNMGGGMSSGMMGMSGGMAGMAGGMGGMGSGMMDAMGSSGSGFNSGRAAVGSGMGMRTGGSIGMGGGSGLLGGGNSTGSFGGSMSSGTGMGGGKLGGLSGSSGLGGRDSSNYMGGSGASGLLPSPSKYMTPAGQKRSHSQLLPKPEPSPDQLDYIGQHSQGIGGHYMDSFKRSRLF